MSHLAEPVAQEPDRVPGRAIVWTGVVVALVTLASVGVVVVFLEAEERRLRATAGDPGQTAPVLPAPREIGIVDQGDILEPQAARLLERQRRALGSWGWVDRTRGIVRMPIERAMEVVADAAP